MSNHVLLPSLNFDELKVDPRNFLIALQEVELEIWALGRRGCQSFNIPCGMGLLAIDIANNYILFSFM